MSQYGKNEFWEERYTKQPEPFDWYQIYSGLKDVITQYINKTDKILNVGAGNSRLSEDMYEDGYENIINVDISHTVTKIMEEKCKSRCPKMVYKQLDVLDMSEFKTGEFNTVLDKGTLDSVLCGDNSTTNAEKMLDEICRVLAPNGIYICVSHGDEDHRKRFFKKFNWEIKIDKIAKPSSMIATNLVVDDKDSKNFHFIYTMTKYGK